MHLYTRFLLPALLDAIVTRRQTSRLGLISLTIFSSFIASTSMPSFAKPHTEPVVESVERIKITGSRLKKMTAESVNPVTVIDAKYLKAQGFNTVYEALQSFTGATGDKRGQAMGGSARNAETLNLRSLGPNRTLFLLNGKRVANYPRVFDGDYNVFNIATISTAIIDRIEIVSGASSSIYGSDAMAGVVNIITKQDIQSTSLDFDIAQSGHGDARNKRFSLVTGGSAQQHSWSAAFEYEKQDMLKGKQRDWLNDRFDTPADLASQGEFRTALGRALSVFHMPAGADDFTALDPTQETCDRYSDYTYTSITGLGPYCGRDATGDAALIHERENLSTYFSHSYQFNNSATLSTNVLFWQSDAMREDAKGWSSDYLKDEIIQGDNALGDGMFMTQDGTAYMIMREFRPQELLDGKGLAEQFEETMFNLSMALSGKTFNDYEYEFYLSHSIAKDTQTSYQLKKEQASDYFVHHNPTTGELTFDANKWWQPLDEEGFNTIFGLDTSRSDASVSTAGLTLAGTLFESESNPTDFAAFIEFELSQYDVNQHPRTLGQQGQGWVGKTGTVGSGSRDRYAFGGELNLPLSQTLTLSTSARYDRYIDDTAVAGAPTYKLGMEWRPMEQLLFRASHGSIFRAPDLHNIHKGISGSETYIRDDVLIQSCDALNQGRFDEILIGNNNLEALSQTCSQQDGFSGFYATSNQSSGNSALKEETGFSSGAGIVWSPVANTSLAIDLFRIKIEDLVTPDSINNLTLNEWQCLSGQQDTATATCQHALNSIQRNDELGYDSYKINALSTTFVNTAMQKTTGFDVAFNTTLPVGDIAELRIQSQYTHILSNELQNSTTEPVNKDYRDNYYNGSFRSKVNTVVELLADNWNISLAHSRYGSLPNHVRNGNYSQVERQRYAPLNLYNLGLGYQFLQQQHLRLGVVNLFDSKARSDASEQHYPYFKTWAYPQTSVIIGRQFSLSYQIEF